MFIMRQKAHSISAQGLTNTSSSYNVWFVDWGASNHMMSHEDWFCELRKPDWPGYVETGDDTTHSIRHIGNVPLGNDGIQTYLKNFLHVPTITKNLVSVGQIVEQGMQVWFNNEGCFIEKDDQIMALFILESSEVKSTMFANAIKVETNLKLWHKRIGHTNLQTPKRMQSKGVVIRLLTFTEKEIMGVCDAYQFRKPFPNKGMWAKGS